MAYASVKSIPQVNGKPCTRKCTKSGKLACETPGCQRVATQIVHGHARNNGRPADQYRCEKHASSTTLTVVGDNPSGYIAVASIVQLSPMAFEVWGHEVTPVK